MTSRTANSTTLTARRVAITAAVATVVFWALKALAIYSAGGLNQSPLESPLFVLGLLALLVVFAAVGIHLADPRPAWQRVLAALLAALLGVVVFFGFEDFARSFVPESAGWVREEVGLWVGSVLTLVLVLMFIRPRVGTRG